MSWRRIAERAGARIILDESLLRAAQLSGIAEHPRRWIANVPKPLMFGAGGLLKTRSPGLNGRPDWGLELERGDAAT